MGDVAVIVPAGGTSSRFGGTKNKLEEELAGVPVLVRTVQAFFRRADVGLIVVPTRMEIEKFPGMAEMLANGKVRACPGGRWRAESVLNALRAVPAAIEWVAVHDGARPLVSQGLIDRTFAAAREHGAAVPAMPVQVTVKEATGPLPAQVERTVPRARLWGMQTPQVMRRRSLAEAFEKCPLPLEQVTDDVQLLELAGHPVWLVAGEERNLKVTTRMDLRVAEMILAGDA